MKILFKLAAIAAAIGMAPAAVAQPAPGPATPTAQATQQPSAPPTDAISAQSQANPAQPEQSSDPAQAPTIANEAPSDASVAGAVNFTPTSPEIGVGQPSEDRWSALQPQFTPI